MCRLGLKSCDATKVAGWVEALEEYVSPYSFHSTFAESPIASLTSSNVLSAPNSPPLISDGMITAPSRPFPKDHQ